MADTSNIKALVAELRLEADMAREFGFPNSGKAFDVAADALERQQAVVKAATRYQNHHNNVNRLAMFHALAALDALPKRDGGGTTPWLSRAVDPEGDGD